MRMLFITVIAAMAATLALTGSALAETEAPTTQEQVAVTDEATSDPCGDCPIHLASDGPIEVVRHTIFGESIQVRCLLELTGAVDAVGTGQIDYDSFAFLRQGLTINGIDCVGGVPVHMCTSAEADALYGPSSGREDWPFEIVEDHSVGEEWMRLGICLGGVGGADDDLSGDVWLRVGENGHLPTFASSDHRLADLVGGSGQDTEFTGSFLLGETDEGFASIEIAH
jgi:hypothetical protein